tara:strand:- start:562 stop:1296 length:735 start_codon:yes stop_codon:yes gene_type:complete
MKKLRGMDLDTSEIFYKDSDSDTDYSKTVIYKIICKDTTIIESYGGHSVDLYYRTSRHKSSCNNPNDKCYNSYVYQFIRENGGWDNWDVVWQYNYPCNNKTEALEEEKKFIAVNNCELNSINPLSTEEEKKQKQKETKRKTYAENKEAIIETIKQKYAEKIENETEEEKTERKRKEAEYSAKRYANIKETETEEEKAERKRKKAEYDAQKVKCEICDIEIRKGEMRRHEKRKKHLKNLEQYLMN